jgi:hypothetical protein
MKKSCTVIQFIAPSLTLLLMLLGLASCTSPRPTLPTATSVVFAASPTIAASSTPIPASPTSTVTLTPTPTQTRIPRPTSTPRPTKTPTPTTYPTLDSQGRLNFVLEAMKTNMGCELPCWWGITPGQTTWEEMIDTFVKQSIGFDTYESGKLYLGMVTSGNYLEPTVDVVFSEGGGLVQSIGIRTEYYYILAQPKYFDAWHDYALDKVLARYGIPTQVYLQLTTGAADWSPGMRATYDLWVEYANKGIALRYPGELIHDNQGWYVCPVFGNIAGIEIRLQSPESTVALIGPDLGDQGYGFNGTLSDLTGVSRQRFYEMFKQNPPQGCLLAADPNPWWYDKITLPKPSMILPVAQEEEYLINNLAGNAGCELPCWWGIKPGETTTQYVQQMFLNLGKSVSRNEDSRGLQYRASLFGRHSPYPFDYTVEHRWFDKNGIVDLFGVTGSALNWSPPQHFAQDWHRYALHEALARYGVPSKVLVHYWSFGWQYNIALVYEDQGFLIAYSGLIGDGSFDYSENPLSICPTHNRPTRISIWMAQPKSAELKKLGFSYGEISSSYPFVLSLEEVTPLTTQSFYETFLNPDTTTCLTVPREKGEMGP